MSSALTNISEETLRGILQAYVPIKEGATIIFEKGSNPQFHIHLSASTSVDQNTGTALNKIVGGINTKELTMSNDGDTYNVEQAGAVGKDARSDHNTFIKVEQNQTLAEAAKEIQNLLNQLERANPTASEDEQITYINDETTRSFQRRVAGALREGGEAAIDEFILENKYLKVIKAILKGWMQG